MKVYFSLFYIRVLNGLQYRTVVIGAILTRFVWGMMEILAFNALYRTDGTAFVMTFSETVSYIVFDISNFGSCFGCRAGIDNAYINVLHYIAKRNQDYCNRCNHFFFGRNNTVTIFS